MDGPLEITGAESPRQALTALHAHLAAHVDADLLPCTADRLDDLLGADAHWTDPAAMTDPSRSIGRTQRARELRLLADDMVTLLETQAPHLAAASSPADRDRAHLYGRTAVGLLRYHSWMADTSPSRMARLLATRDEMMVNNLLALAERGPVLVFAHNSHLQRDKSAMRMWGHPRVEWWSAGALVSTRLGDQYAHVATALGTLRHHGVDTPPPDTVEGILHAVPDPQYVIDAARLATAARDTRTIPACPRTSATPPRPVPPAPHRRGGVREARPARLERAEQATTCVSRSPTGQGAELPPGPRTSTDVFRSGRR